MQQREARGQGYVRADLLGGTLDIWPINLVLKEASTINCALSLGCQVRVSEEVSAPDLWVEIISLDYGTSWKYSRAQWEALDLVALSGDENFIVRLVKYFHDFQRTPLSIQTKTDIPPGSGLGGSSTMGVTLFSALAQFFHQSDRYSRLQIIQRVADIEATILDLGATGYQDYYPSLWGGVLELSPRYGEVQVHQHYSAELANYLRANVLLCYSAERRKSAINNWEVYKNFFDRKGETRQGLAQIGHLSALAAQALRAQKWDEFVALIGAEGAVRAQLFSNIVTEQMGQFTERVQALLGPSYGGMKVCGAGGGGCFLLLAPARWQTAIGELARTQFAGRIELLDYQLTPPL